MKLSKFTTRTGTQILEEHLITKFIYNNKEAPIGAFDPSNYDQTFNGKFDDLDFNQTILDQLEDTKIFEEFELIEIANLTNREFNTKIKFNKNEK